MKIASLALVLTAWCASLAAAEADRRPNVLWITSEDTGPHLGVYGDRFADTPNLDRLAAKGMIYLNAWSNAPVCAPARTTIISGVYPPCTGSEHMRSMTRLPEGMKMYPQYLRQSGYYCTNNSKEDYNLRKPGKVWDDSSGKGHWRNRRPGQPFFAIFNFTESHESQIRTRPHTPVHDPAKVRVPAYHPDTPEVRRDWAQYYDKVTEIDARAGRVLRQLEADGLADETIVFYYGDHGSGMPRSKRWPYNSGLNVPLIVFVPEKFKHLAPKQYVPGGKSDRLVGFIDLAPTLLSIAGIEPPAFMQGHAFMGRYEAPEQPYAYGFRGRMDERYDMVRSVRDKRYVYVRNYMPHKIYGQHVSYMFETPTTQVWKRLYDAGELAPPQTFFWQTKPPEELYDLQNDPDEVHNLAGSAEHQQILTRLRQAQQDLAMEIRDVGFLPEGEIHSRSERSTPYEMGHDDKKYPIRKIMAAAELASSLKPEAVENLKKALQDEDSAVRYWGAMGILMRGPDAVAAAKEDLHNAMQDASPYVRIVAAEALGRYGDQQDAAKALAVLLELAPLDANGIYVSVLGLNALDALDGKAKSALDAIKRLPRQSPSVPGTMTSYVPRLIEQTLAELTTASAPSAPGAREVVFSCDFESDDWYKQWSVRQPDERTEIVAADPKFTFQPLRGKALRIKVERGGHYGTSLQFNFQKQLGQEPEEIYFRYYLRLADDWDPAQGGKLPGIAGTYGRAGWGGRKVNGRDGWSARGLFHGRKDGRTPAGFYCYHADMKGQYGAEWVWEKDRLGYLENNRWYSIEQYAKMNTPGKNDGILRAWVDGRLAFEKTDLRMRDVESLKIETVWLNVYLGGSWTARSDHHLYIDEVVISRKYIGPLSPSAKPPSGR